MLHDWPVYALHAAAVGAIDRSTHRFGRQAPYTEADLLRAAQVAGLPTDPDLLKRFANYHQSTSGTLSEAAIRTIALQPLSTHLGEPGVRR